MNSEYIEVALDSGQVVKVFPVPPYEVTAALASIKPPEIPKRKIDPEAAIPGVTDDQMIDWPESPDYQKEFETFKMKRLERFVDTRLLYGLAEEKPPKNWPTDDDTARWKFLGIEVEVPTDRFGKQLAWIKHGLIRSGRDMDVLTAAIDSFAETPKEEVNDLIASFRRGGKRDAIASVSA